MPIAAYNLVSFGRRLGVGLIAAGLTIGALAQGAAPANAYVVCSDNQDACTAYPDTVQTPLGLVTVTVNTDTNAVTVELAATAADTRVVGIPHGIAAGANSAAGFTRTSIDTAGGLVNIDTFLHPPSPIRPSLALISIHPPSPIRAITTGTTVRFFPPGPPV